MSRQVKSSVILTVTLVLVLLSFSPAVSQGKVKRRLPPFEYGTVLMNNFSEQNQIAPVVFRHWVHRSKHTCRLCHVDIGFAMEAGKTIFREEDNRKGQYCGVCHNGKEAFRWEEKNVLGQLQQNCNRCHALAPIGMDEGIKQSFVKLAETLPEGRFGNGIDWAKASRDGLIRPKDFIEGVSFPRQKMQNEEGNVNLDAKLNGLPDIVFSHKEHAVWNSCDLCHPDLFALKAGKTKFTMQEIFAGSFCGACHGNVSFPLQDCGRCHTKPVN